MNYNALEMDKEITKVFASLMKERGLSPQEALDYLDYDIFVRNSNWFFSLSEEKQSVIRMTLHAIKLVHK